MAKPRKSVPAKKKVVDTKHGDDKRSALPPAALEPLVNDRLKLAPVTLRWARNPDLDPQLVWRGKDTSADPLTVRAFPIYIHEKIHPRELIQDLRRESERRSRDAAASEQPELFSDFNGVPAGVDRTDYYNYECNWQNRMILGDSLQVMASLAEKENLRGKVQCVYMDPPYGIKFQSNFQGAVTTASDGKTGTQEPEMVKAFRDTWRDGIHSYLAYLRDRFVVARDLLAETGSIFVQIGDENVHRVRAVLDEVFGAENFEAQIAYASTAGFSSNGLDSVTNFVLWYSRNHEKRKFHALYKIKEFGGEGASSYGSVELENGERMSIAEYEKRTGTQFDYDRRRDANERCRVCTLADVTSQGAPSIDQTFEFRGKKFSPNASNHWKTDLHGMSVLARANRLDVSENGRLGYIRYFDDFSLFPINNIWTDAGSSFMKKIYVVQTATKIIQRCLLMTTDPGDLVLDPTCGSGTTAYVAEQWGRRWITIDTSRVALTLARARLMGARFPYYVLADSPEGLVEEARLSGCVPAQRETFGKIRQGFVCKRVPHIKLSDIANNAEIDVIWKKYECELAPLRKKLGGREEWEIPRTGTPEAKKFDAKTLEKFWEKKLARQREIDVSIAAHAEFETLYDQPIEDPKKVRVAGPFTVESLDPHRTLGTDADGNVIDPVVAMETQDVNAAREAVSGIVPAKDFVEMVLENLRVAGVQQVDKKERIVFESLEPYCGDGYICAEGKYRRGEKLVRAGIFVGPEFATVTRPELLAAAVEARKHGFDELITCAFNYGPFVASEEKLGTLKFIKARMNADLHMGGDFKKTANANLFVVFGEPDVEIHDVGDGNICVEIKGIDIFKPSTGEVISNDTDGIACWFIDTDYDQESFFVRQVYFCGQKDPYGNLKNALIAEIDRDAWESLYKTKSRPFPRPKSGFIAVKVINKFGDEALQVFRV